MRARALVARSWLAAAAGLALLATRAAAIDPPHDAANLTNGCADCHMVHWAPGPFLTSRADNPTLCLSCHATRTEPTVAGWQATDQATAAGTTGTSHSWSGLAAQPAVGAAAPSQAALARRLAGGTALQCSTCHDQHSQASAPFDPTAPASGAGRHFLRASNAGSQLCVDCHAAWNQGSAAAGTYFSGTQATFGAASAVVTGAGTTWTTQLVPGDELKRQSDDASAWTVVRTVDSDTQVTLVENYRGTAGTNVAWQAARVLTHPVGVPLPAASALTRTVPTEVSGLTQVSGFWGAATGGSTTSLADASKSFTGAVGWVIRFTSGANRNLTRTVTSVGGGGTSVSFAAVPTPVAAGDRYEIDGDGNFTNNLHLSNGGVASFTTGNVVCLSCHEVHFGDSDATTYDDRPPASTGDGKLLRRSRTETCDGCHPSSAVHSSATTSTKHGTWGTTFTCRTCHDPHRTTNVHLVTPSLATPNLGAVAVDFRASASGQAVYGDVDSSTLSGQQTTGRGPCEACHTDTRNGNVYSTGTVNVSAGGVVTCAAGCSWTAGQFAGWEFRVASDAAAAWTRITGNTTTGLTLGSASGNVYAGTTGLTGVAYLVANPRYRGLSAGRNNRGSGEGAVGNEHYETNCLQCHPHDKGFAAGESSGGSACDGCHGDIWNRVTGTTTTTSSGAAIVSKHTLGNVPATNASPNDTNLTWADPLSANAASSRSCVNMCHDDHPHTVTGVTTHEYNAYRDATSQASRAATTRDTATKAKTDFDAAATSGGMCLSCHRSSVDANRPAVDKAAFTASKHNYTSNTVGATTYTWTYGQHDGGVFDRNCTKCHNDPGDSSPSDTTQPFAAVHFSRYPSLLFGNVNPAAAGNTLGGNVCMQCHGDGTTGVDRSGRPMAAVFSGRVSSHPVGSDAVHGAAELAVSYEGQATGGTRHVNCLDCHDPHAAGAAHDTGTATAAGATSLTDASKSGAWAANQWTGYRVVITATGAAGTGQAATVTGNTTAGVVNVSSWPGGTPPAGAAYTLTKMGTGEVSAATSGVGGITVTPTTSYNVGSATFVQGSATVHSGALGGIVSSTSYSSRSPIGTTVFVATHMWPATTSYATYTMRIVASATPARVGTTFTISSSDTTNRSGANLFFANVNYTTSIGAGDTFVVYRTATADTPIWTSAMAGGYVRNELDRNGRWYRIAAVAQPTAGTDYYTLTIAPAYDRGTGAAPGLSSTKMTSGTDTDAQWYMDHGTLYSISAATVARTASATMEYQICVRCHSSDAFGDSPPNVPSGHVDGSTVRETNVLHDFNSGQLSYHPIYAVGKNQPTAVTYAGWNLNAPFTRVDNTGSSATFGLSNTFTTGWTKESLLRCSDCHTSDTASDPIGPHGSGKRWLLKGLDPSVCWTRRNSGGTGWEQVCNSTVPSGTTAEANNYCLNCHRWDVYGYKNLPGLAPASVLSRVPHDVTGNSNTYKAAFPTSDIVCNQCHGGDRIGGAHGSSRRRYPFGYDPSTSGSTAISTAPGSYSGKRLLNGAYWYGVTRATTTTPVACWGKAGTDTVSQCAHAHEDYAGNNAQYSYDDAPDP